MTWKYPKKNTVKNAKCKLVVARWYYYLSAPATATQKEVMIAVCDLAEKMGGGVLLRRLLDKWELNRETQAEGAL